MSKKNKLIFKINPPTDKKYENEIQKLKNKIKELENKILEFEGLKSEVGLIKKSLKIK